MGVKWMDLPNFDDRPVLGPPCPGPNIHAWSLAIEEGQMSLYSGCEECEEGILGPMGGEDVGMGPIKGRLECHVERYYGGDVDVWWEFIPEGVQDA
jgi:hypothetical protein